MSRVRGVLVVGALLAGAYILSQVSPLRQQVGATIRPAAPAETYRLILARGNAETESARGLSYRECQDRKAELTAISNGIGATNTQLGLGSVTCLPESTF